MDIVAYTCKRLCIPFQIAFSHASATRTETESLWVEISSSSRITGFGESCPRVYVTGESLNDAIQWINNSLKEISISIHDFDDLLSFEKSHINEIDQNPAAWCAIELALLDLLSKDNNQSVEELLGINPLKKSYIYTAVLGDAKQDAFIKQAERYLKLGFTDFKVKLSGSYDRDTLKLEYLFAVKDIRVRLDANNLWHDATEAVKYLNKIGAQSVNIEEPTIPYKYADMAEISNLLDTKIILDESFLRTSQFKHLSFFPNIWIINIRVSKMGGLLRSLEVVARCRELNIPVIVGAQVGETSLLTRAALTVANAVGDSLYAQEGAFGTHLLTEDICKPILMFGKAGRLDITSQHNSDYGFGISVNNHSYFQPC